MHRGTQFPYFTERKDEIRVNHCVFIGHPAKTPRILEGKKRNLTAYFTLVVKRETPYKKVMEDYIPCIAISNNIAKKIATYVRKGTYISVMGRWQNNNSWVDGEFKPGHELLLTDIEFLEKVKAKGDDEILIEIAENSKYEFHTAEKTPFEEQGIKECEIVEGKENHGNA